VGGRILLVEIFGQRDKEAPFSLKAAGFSWVGLVGHRYSATGRPFSLPSLDFRIKAVMQLLNIAAPGPDYGSSLRGGTSAATMMRL
jgi:hypothetical protein